MSTHVYIYIVTTKKKKFYMQGMRLVKLQGGQAVYQKQLTQARELEMHELKWQRYLTAGNTLLGALLSISVPVHTHAYTYTNTYTPHKQTQTDRQTDRHTHTHTHTHTHRHAHKHAP